MARQGLRFDLGSAFLKALRQKDAGTVKDLSVGETDEAQRVDITIRAIEEPEALRGMAMIVFTDVPTPPKEKTVIRSKTSPVANTQFLKMEQDLRLIARSCR